MATELTLLLLFPNNDPPTADDIEDAFDAVVLEYLEEEVD